MKLPLQISFHGIDRSPALEAAISEKAHGLSRFDSALISCRVTVEQEGRHQHQGREVAVRIDLSTPGKEIVVTRKNEDAFAATNEAFDAIRRVVKDEADQRRGD